MSPRVPFVIPSEAEGPAFHGEDRRHKPLTEPTGPMKREAAEAGFYTSLKGRKRLERPFHVRDVTFKSAPKHESAKAENLSLDL